MKFIVVSALLVALPSLSSAALSMDKALSCEIAGTSFFEPLILRKLIAEKPYLVEDSISHFRPLDQLISNNPGGLYAFGLRVDSVFGYVRGQLHFKRGPGTEPPTTYGVVVNADISETNSRLFAAGVSKAVTSTISKNRTAITCEGMPNEIDN